jgi:hypothetical protein
VRIAGDGTGGGGARPFGRTHKSWLDNNKKIKKKLIIAVSKASLDCVYRDPRIGISASGREAIAGTYSRQLLDPHFTGMLENPQNLFFSNPHKHWFLASCILVLGMCSFLTYVLPFALHTPPALALGATDLFSAEPHGD